MKKLVILFALAAVAACGGGGGGGSPSVAPPVNTPTPPAGAGGGTSSPSPTPTNSPTPPPTPTPSPTPTPTPSPAALAITANIPQNDKANFENFPVVFGVRLLSANGTAANVVSTQRSTCSSRSCKVNITAPVGTDEFSITYAYGADGSAMSSLAPLAYHGSFAVSVGANVSNTASVSLLGVPAFYELDAVGSAPFTGSMPLLLQSADDANVCTPPQQINGCTIANFIPGTLAAPITLTDTDTSGATLLSINGSAGARAVHVLHASDSVSLIITSGANVQQGYVTPSASFNASEFGAAYTSITDTPWTTQDPNGLGFTCSSGSCQTTGPSSVTIQ